MTAKLGCASPRLEGSRVWGTGRGHLHARCPNCQRSRTPRTRGSGHIVGGCLAGFRVLQRSELRGSLRQREKRDDRKEHKNTDRNKPGYWPGLINPRRCLCAPVGWTEPPGSEIQHYHDEGDGPDAGPISDKQVGSGGSRIVDERAGICPLLEHRKPRDEQGYRANELERSQDIAKVLRMSEVRQKHADVLDMQERPHRA